MAKRRCISIDIYESEDYLTLSDKAKVLYTQFILRSDDEGVVINPKTAMRLVLAEDSTLEELIKAGLVLKVSGIYVIRHWNLHNKIQPSKLIESLYRKELSSLTLTEQKSYELSGGKIPEESRPNISKANSI